MFADFEQKSLETSGAKINLVVGGSGPAVLLLHGYPQTHHAWHKVAPLLAHDFTVVATDLRGYGNSSKPHGDEDHNNYSKRTLARDQVEVMSQLGFEQFFLVGHDRGARVSYRLALDYPERVKRVAMLDVIPACKMYSQIDRNFVKENYHWFFLSQPHPIPEKLIEGKNEFFLNYHLQKESADMSAFAPKALAEYLKCFNQPDTIHSICEDFRAAATVDWENDLADMNVKIHCPLLALWGDKGTLNKRYNVLAIWWSRGSNVRGKAISGSHFLPEESPEETHQALRDFFLTDSFL